MKKKDVIKHFGSVRKAAQALDLWPQTLYGWGDVVPDAMAYKIQVITNGALMVEDKKDGGKL